MNKEVIIISENYISIDGGGSKTEVCIYNPYTEQMDIKVYDGININQIGEAQFAQRICQIFANLPLNKSYRMCIGIPGYSESSEMDYTIDQILKNYLNSENYIAINDVHLAHFASLGLADGILLLSGTGSMAMKIKQDTVSRVGGWGHLIGDEGSAFSIGIKALNHISHVFDDLCEPSYLSTLICEEYKFDFASKLVNFVYGSNNYRKEVAKFAVFVDRAAQANCPIANQILELAAEDLSRLVTNLVDEPSDKISYAGSVFNSQILRSKVQKHGHFTMDKPRLCPALGGILKLYNDENNKCQLQAIIMKLNQQYIKAKEKE